MLTDWEMSTDLKRKFYHSNILLWKNMSIERKIFEINGAFKGTNSGYLKEYLLLTHKWSQKLTSTNHILPHGVVYLNNSK